MSNFYFFVVVHINCTHLFNKIEGTLLTRNNISFTYKTTAAFCINVIENLRPFNERQGVFNSGLKGFLLYSSAGLPKIKHESFFLNIGGNYKKIGHALFEC